MLKLTSSDKSQNSHTARLTRPWIFLLSTLVQYSQNRAQNSRGVWLTLLWNSCQVNLGKPREIELETRIQFDNLFPNIIAAQPSCKDEFFFLLGAACLDKLSHTLARIYYFGMLIVHSTFLWHCLVILKPNTWRFYGLGRILSLRHLKLVLKQMGSSFPV